MSLDHTPLASVSIEEIFAADPTTLTDAEFAALVAEVRRRRSVFHAEEAAKQAKGKKASAPKAPAMSAAETAKVDKPTSELDISDLFN